MSDKKLLLSLLQNETDMCFRRRALVLFDYLELTENDHLLDCGCGRGFFSRMANLISSCKVTGFELDPELIEIAKENKPSDKVEFKVGDITALPIASESFSKVICTEVLEHIEADKKAMSEIYRVLTPGGIAALSVPNQRYPFCWDPINWLLETLFNKPIRTGIFSGIWAFHVRLYTEEQFIELAQSVGFKIKKVDRITYFCFPFIHNIVYGFGKELLVAGLLPDSIAKASDRFRNEENSGSLLNPVNLMRKIFLTIDSLNDIWPPKKSSVLLSILVEKPK